MRRPVQLVIRFVATLIQELILLWFSNRVLWFSLVCFMILHSETIGDDERYIWDNLNLDGPIIGQGGREDWAMAFLVGG